MKPSLQYIRMRHRDSKDEPQLLLVLTLELSHPLKPTSTRVSDLEKAWLVHRLDEVADRWSLKASRDDIRFMAEATAPWFANIYMVVEPYE